MYSVLSFIGSVWLLLLIKKIWITTKRIVPANRLPFTDIAMAQTGIVKVVGKISAEQLIHHQAQTQPCVYYHYAEYRKYKTHRSYHHNRSYPPNHYSYDLLHSDKSSAQNIYIQDATGKIYLDPKDLEFDLHTYAESYNKITSTFATEHYRTNEIHIAELLDQSDVLAIGEVQFINGQKTLVKSKNHPYFVSSIRKMIDLEQSYSIILAVAITLLLSIILCALIYLLPSMTNHIDNLITTYFPNAWAFLLEQTSINAILTFVAFFVGCIAIITILQLISQLWLTKLHDISSMISYSLLLTQPIFIGLCILQSYELFSIHMLWIATFMTLSLNLLLSVVILIWAAIRSSGKSS